MTRYDCIWVLLSETATPWHSLAGSKRLHYPQLDSSTWSWHIVKRSVTPVENIFHQFHQYFDNLWYTDIDVHFGISIADVAMRLWSEVRTCNGCKWPCPSGYKAWDAEYSEPRTTQDDVHSLHVAGPFVDGPFRTTSQPFAEFQCGSMQHCSSLAILALIWESWMQGLPASSYTRSSKLRVKRSDLTHAHTTLSLHRLQRK